jgi:tetratricopeptide (TPR) repeat protein
VEPEYIVGRMMRQPMEPTRTSDEPAYAKPYDDDLEAVMTAIAHGDREGALARAARWQQREPGDVAALVALGEALEARGQGALAARAYGSLLDLYPDRADLARAAGERLDRLPGARALAIDAYRRAIRERPDQVSTYRLLAYALVRAGERDEAIRVLREGIARATRPSIHEILVEDVQVIGGHRPSSLRVVLSWETDANDVDLHVTDRHGEMSWYKRKELPSGGALRDDVTDGFGPEMFEVDQPDAFPYHIAVHYFARGPMGVGLGSAQIVRTDATGRVTVEDRPFVIQNDHALVDLGVVTR